MMFSILRKYWSIGLGALVGVLMIAVKILTSQNSHLRRKVETADARIKHNKAVAVQKIKTEQVFKSRRADIVNELKEKKSTKELSDPNEDWE